MARTGEPVIPSLENIGLLSIPGTDLKGFFDLNVRRADAAKNYLKLFRDNEIDVIMMPPAAHTAVPLDHWTKAAYNCLWNYLDYPAIVVPTDHVRDTDSADDLSNAQFGPEDEELYSLCTCPFLSMNFCNSSSHMLSQIPARNSTRTHLLVLWRWDISTKTKPC